MPSFVAEAGSFITGANANANIGAGSGVCFGIFVSSASNTPLMCVQDAPQPQAANGNAIMQEFVPVAATFYPCPAQFQYGLSVRIGGNVAYTAYYRK